MGRIRSARRSTKLLLALFLASLAWLGVEFVLLPDNQVRRSRIKQVLLLSPIRNLIPPQDARLDVSLFVIGDEAVPRAATSPWDENHLTEPPDGWVLLTRYRSYVGWWSPTTEFETVRIAVHFILPTDHSAKDNPAEFVARSVLAATQFAAAERPEIEWLPSESEVEAAIRNFSDGVFVSSDRDDLFVGNYLAVHRPHPVPGSFFANLRGGVAALLVATYGTMLIAPWPHSRRIDQELEP